MEAAPGAWESRDVGEMQGEGGGGGTEGESMAVALCLLLHTRVLGQRNVEHCQLYGNSPLHPVTLHRGHCTV